MLGIIVQFSHFTADDTHQIITQLLSVHLEDLSALGDRDIAGLLGNNDRHRVGDFTDADGRSVTGAITGRQFHIGGREISGCAGNLVTLDNDRAIMQRCGGHENRCQQFRRHIGIHSGAGLDIVL